MCASPFWGKEGPHLFVDGVRLDVFIEGLMPEAGYLGLIPSFWPVFGDMREFELVWERALPIPYNRVWLPLLICPDDVDLYCTVVGVGMKIESEGVRWEALARETTSQTGDGYEWVGSEVTPIPGAKPMLLSLEDYLTALEAFEPQRVARWRQEWDGCL